MFALKLNETEAKNFVKSVMELDTDCMPFGKGYFLKCISFNAGGDRNNRHISIYNKDNEIISTIDIESQYYNYRILSV